MDVVVAALLGGEVLDLTHHSARLLVERGRVVRVADSRRGRGEPLMRSHQNFARLRLSPRILAMTGLPPRDESLKVGSPCEFQRSCNHSCN